MHIKTQNSIYSLAALFLVFSLLLPASLAFIHSTQNHDHIDRCEVTSDTHMHELSLDCDFDEIVLQKLSVYAFAKAQLTPPPTYPTFAFAYSPFISSETILQTTSRGPPAC